ncbi:hypothetical protein FB451DRAFT_1571807 [Mycena latifolia]|nr:hypothetical protein FB451DRAFT_1571807 [Mycena latifolia]
MVLTRRAYKAISRWLPNEVITQIIQAASKEDQASLCRVSKLFHGLCLPIFNRTVRLGHYGRASTFCAAIIANPTRALAIRSFTVLNIWEPRLPAHPPDALSKLLIKVMKLMSRLEYLSIHPYALKGPSRLTLLQLYFPCLFACDIGPSPPHLAGEETREGDAIALFLALHSNLTRVRISSNSRLTASPVVRVPLPNVQHYDGPAGLIPTLVLPGLKVAKLDWHAGETSSTAIDRIIRALHLLTTPEIPIVSSHDYDDRCCTAIVTSVSAHMPHTKTLQMRPLREYHRLLDEDIRHIIACLPRFTGLVYLAMERRISGFPTDKDEDCITVKTWGEACPTLKACCLSMFPSPSLLFLLTHRHRTSANNYAWRKVDATWEEYPMLDFQSQAGLIDANY